MSTNDDLQKQITHLCDMQAIANLQGRFLYCIQAHDDETIVELFAKNDAEVSVEIAESGVYVGSAKVRAFFTELIGPFFNSPGVLPIHMLTTPVIDIAECGTVAYGMWQTLGCNTFEVDNDLTAVWQQGKYDNVFVKENGQWRIKQLCWLCNFRTPFDKGWVKQPMVNVEPLDFTQFPESIHPSHPGEPYDVYDPKTLMDFGPLPKSIRKN